MNPPNRQTIVEVAAGLVFHQRRLLITQRPATGHLANLWEFPGGKREPGETFEECLHRELKEELGIEVDRLIPAETIEHAYPEKTVLLRFYRCRLLAGEPRPIECQALRWIAPDELEKFTFPPADDRLLHRLRNTPDWWSC